jgi:hypothetical protein
MSVAFNPGESVAEAIRRHVSWLFLYVHDLDMADASDLNKCVQSILFAERNVRHACERLMLIALEAESDSLDVRGAAPQTVAQTSGVSPRATVPRGKPRSRKAG